MAEVRGDSVSGALGRPEAAGRDERSLRTWDHPAARRRWAVVLLILTLAVAVAIATGTGSGSVGHNGFRILLAGALLGAATFAVLVPANGSAGGAGRLRALTLVLWLLDIVMVFVAAGVAVVAFGRALADGGSGWLVVASAVGLLGALLATGLAGKTWLAGRRSSPPPDGRA